MASDPGTNYPPMTWKVRLVVAYLSVIWIAVARGILPPSWALRLRAPFRDDDAWRAPRSRQP